MRLHVHLLSDSTGETLENIAKAALAQFDDVETLRHFWPMVRSETHLERILQEIAQNPGLVLFTLVNADIRKMLEARCRAMGLPAVAPLDGVSAALTGLLGQEAKARPGRQHVLDAAYFARVDAIQFTIAHDDGIAWEEWEEADIVLAGVSRSSKTPTSIYLANRGFKTANIPIVVESPPPPSLFSLHNPLIVGLTTSAERLIQVRRNRLLSLNEKTETDYVAQDAVAREVAYARRMFADNGWPVIDVTRRSIEETAAAIITLCNERRWGAGMTLILASASASRRAMLNDAGIAHEAVSPQVDEAAAKASLAELSARDLADALAELKATKVARLIGPGPMAGTNLVLGCDSTVALADGTLLDKPGSREQAADHLRAMSGGVHDLFSAAVLVRDGAPIWRHVDRARMTVRPLSDDFIERYLDAEWPAIAGCVGCYRIEARHPAFLADRGSHFTILGLPSLPLAVQLRILGHLPS